jgi:outer membrane protein TolC
MRKFSLMVLFFCAVNFGFAQSKITLEQCLDLSESNHPTATNLPLIRQTADLQVRLLNSNYLPQSSLGGQASWQSEVTSLPISLPNVSISPPPKDQYRATLDVVQNIWDGGVLSKQKEVAVANAKAEEQKLVTDLYQIKEQVSGLYFGILFAEKQIENAQILRKDLETKSEKMRAAISNGTAIKSNLLALDAKLLEVNQLLTDAQKRRMSSVEALELLTGKTLGETTVFELPRVFSTASQDISRPELLLLDNQKSVLDINQEMVKAKNLPKISAFATGGYGKPGLNFLANSFGTYFIGGVNFKVPLSFLYSGSQSNEIQQIKISQQKIDTQKESFILATKIKLSNQNQEIERLESMVSTDAKILEIRKQIKQTAEAQLDNGIITASDFLTELTNEDIAKQNSILHEVQLLQAKFNLKIISGNLK